jgi:hypothetical protein
MCLKDELWIREKDVCERICDRVGMPKDGKEIGIVLLLKLRMWDKKGKLELSPCDILTFMYCDIDRNLNGFSPRIKYQYSWLED